MEMKGGKAENLEILAKAGFRVPVFVVLDMNISEKQLRAKIQTIYHLADHFAVRSSALVEDSSSVSYAGHFYSAIGVPINRIWEEYKNVIQSYGNDKGGVIIQQFVPSEKAGVLFTDAGEGRMIINSNFGLCKTVVEGESCDEYIVNKYGDLIQKNIVEQKSCLIFEGGQLTRKNIRDKQVLTEKEIKALAKLALNIEKVFKSPQDIEWCIAGRKMYILQSRPITRKISLKPQSVFYDSANIAESYSGIVLPLTLSFASRIYKVVYENLLHSSGVSRHRIRRNQYIFDKMVASFYGRLFYNMNNWYLMMSFVPGYKRNKKNLEEMITSNVRTDIPRSVLPSFWLKIGYPFILVGKLLFFPITIRRFINKVVRTIKYYRQTDIHLFSYEECCMAYIELNKKLLGNWHIPVENDFLVMTYLGILKKKFSDEHLKELIRFENKSSRQINAINELSQAVFKNIELTAAVEKNNAVLFEKGLMNSEELRTLFKNYFSEYGGRFANELKLESSDIEEDKLKLFSLLKLYRHHHALPSDISKNQVIKGMLAFILSQFRKYASRREELRLLRSNTFAIVRKLFNRIAEIFMAEGLISKPADIYYLTTDDLFDKPNKQAGYKDLIKEQIKKYDQYKNLDPPAFFELIPGAIPLERNTEFADSERLIGNPCTTGIVTGKVRIFREFYFPDKIDFDIIVTRHTDPGWTALIGLCKGLIIEHGGILSHAAIVSRELGIPTVIGVANATQILKDGQIVMLNGTLGEIVIQEK